ncbi:MAG: hypothetical protein GY805_30280 [Chloroflexi bacterium]|nr:hypothetical protein [Chloroflexota bacterium]
MSEIVLGLGTNLENRVRILQQSVVGLTTGMVFTAVSTLTQMPFCAIINQPNFLGSYFAVDYHYSPHKSHTLMKNIEAQTERVPNKRWRLRFWELPYSL